MRYQRIHSQIWSDEKFIKLSQDAKYLFIYLLTSPHSNGIGIYVLPKKYIECDLEWSTKQLAIPFDELLNSGLILYDDVARLICIKNHIKHNPIENPKQVKSAEKIISALPKSSLFSAISEQLNKQYHKPLSILLDERYAKPEEEKEEETEKEKEESPSIDYPDWLNMELWEEFRKYRKGIKSKLTPRSEKLCLADLVKLVEEGHDQNEVIKQTLKSEKWKSFYPPKNNNSKDPMENWGKL